MKKGKRINLFVDDGEDRNPNDKKLYNPPTQKGIRKTTVEVICGKCNKTYNVNELLVAGKESFICDKCLVRNKRG